ncbi:putative arrestin domain-containing protein [Lasiodiplodia theobromae]|nr:putative arrestin domain-containing protein [Lasiodiplodia theobromae]
MDIQIVLNPHDQIITTGDIISGRVVLNARRRVTVSTVDVRLKGYIRTSLTAANDSNSETWKPCHVNHEFLSIAKTLLSPASSRKCFWSTSTSFSAGQHGFPFQFRMPATTTYRKDTLGMDGDLMDKLDVKPRTYTERGLPPSFTQPLDEIEIVYCIEATATRPDIFKENLHTTYRFNFRPIEQARDPVPQLTSIKHQHQFDLQRTPTQLTDASSSPSTTSPDFTTTAGLYPELAAETAVMTSPTRELASILIDARLPAPAILVRNHDVPLSLTVRKVNAFAGQLYLRSLHVALIGYTTIQKQQRPSSSSSSRSTRSRSPSPSPADRDEREQGKKTKQREKADTWVIASTCNMRVPIGHPDAPVGARLALPPALWQDRPVPASVAPSFDVLCGGNNSGNSGSVAVARTYELEVTLGLAYEAEEQQRSERGDGEDEDDDEEQRPLSRTVWLPLRRKVEVYADFPVGGAGDVSLEKVLADGCDGHAQTEEYVRAPPSYEMATTWPRP